MPKHDLTARDGVLPEQREQAHLKVFVGDIVAVRLAPFPRDPPGPTSRGLVGHVGTVCRDHDSRGLQTLLGTTSAIPERQRQQGAWPGC